jgi:hypothetical protein
VKSKSTCVFIFLQNIFFRFPQRGRTTSHDARELVPTSLSNLQMGSIMVPFLQVEDNIFHYVVSDVQMVTIEDTP